MAVSSVGVANHCPGHDWCPEVSACEAFIPGRLDGRGGNRLVGCL